MTLTVTLNIWTELVGKALCLGTLLCLETIRQLLSSNVVKCYRMGYLSHNTLPLHTLIAEWACKREKRYPMYNSVFRL